MGIMLSTTTTTDELREQAAVHWAAGPNPWVRLECTDEEAARKLAAMKGWKVYAMVQSPWEEQ